MFIYEIHLCLPMGVYGFIRSEHLIYFSLHNDCIVIMFIGVTLQTLILHFTFHLFAI